MNERGQYRSIERGRQRILFDNCAIPGTNITPTDIDCIYEYHGITWILIEVKMKGTPINMGQEVLIRRFIEDGIKGGKQNLAIIAEHNVIDPEKDIMLEQCVIREVYYPNKNNEVEHSQYIGSIMNCVKSWIKKVTRDRGEVLAI